MRLRPSSFILTVVIVIWVSTIIAVVSSEKISALDSRATFSATLTALAGLVQYRSSSGSTWLTVQDTQLVSEGDEVRTGSNGFARLSSVTGIKADLYPTTQFQLDALFLDDNNGQTFKGTQTVGTIYFSVTPSAQRQNTFQIVLPTASITVQGGQFYAFVSKDIHAAVIAEQGNVQVLSAYRFYTIAPDDFLYMQFQQSAPAVYTTALINSTIADLVISPLSDRPTKIEGIRDFLHDFIISNLNPLAYTYLRHVLGLTTVDYGTITPEQDQAAFNETLNAISTLDASKINLSDFLKQYRDYSGNTYKVSLQAPIAPTTCGNGIQDPGETAQNCPDDFTAPASCGNGICETDRQGNISESLVSCPADCAPGLAVAQSCSELILSIPLGTGTSGNSAPMATVTQSSAGTVQPPVTIPPPPPPPPPPHVPHPSGVGK